MYVQVHICYKYVHVNIAVLVHVHVYNCIHSFIILQPVQLAFLLALYRKMDPRVEKLCIAMKYWAKV